MLDLQMGHGDTGLFNLSVYAADGTPQSLVGGTLLFTASLGIAVPTTISKTSAASGGINITNTAGGANCATLQIDISDTSTLPNALYTLPCKLELSISGKLYLLDYGRLTIKPPIG